MPLQTLQTAPMIAQWLAGLAVLLAAAFAFFAAMRARAHQREAQENLARLAKTQARLEIAGTLLGAGPGALFLWQAAEPAKLYGGADIFTPAGDDPFAEFCAVLAEESREQLLIAMKTLQDRGERFAFPLYGKDERTFASNGKPAGAGVTLFVSDVSAAFEEICLLRDKLRQALDELQLLNGAINAAPLPIWRRGEDGRLIWINNAYRTAINAPAAEGETPPAEDLADTGALADAEKHGDSLRVRTVLHGERRVLDLYEAPEKNGFGMALDVTELEEAQREIRRQLDSQRTTLNLLHTPIAIFHTDKHLEFFNQAFASLWELPPEWLAGGPQHGELLEAMREARLLPEQADFPAWKRKQLGLYTELIHSQEELWHLPDERTLRVVTQPRPQGGLLVLYEDLTAILSLERSFNALTRVQLESLNGLQEGVAVFGVDGRLGLFNPAMLRIWRLNAEQLQDRPHIEHVAGQCQAHMVNPNDWEAIRAGVTSIEAGRMVSEVRMERSDGSVIDCTVAPLPDGGTMITFSDVSDSAQIERALRERNDALETADRLKSEFVSHISYQLRTPLNSIIGFGEILEQEFFGPLNARQHEYTQGLLQASHHLLTLVNDVIDLATIEAGRLDLARAPVDVLGLLTSVRDLSRASSREYDMRLKLECSDDAGVILADSRRLKQVLFNLLSNAFRFSHAGDEITIGARRIKGPDGVEICQLWVDDSGLGIDPDYQKKMFAPFKSRQRKGKEQRAGIGLTLVQSLIELHEGWVEVVSEPGKGAKVTCNLPQTPARIAQQTFQPEGPLERGAA